MLIDVYGLPFQCVRANPWPCPQARTPDSKPRSRWAALAMDSAPADVVKPHARGPAATESFADRS
jgi:hypothetical protein